MNLTPGKSDGQRSNRSRSRLLAVALTSLFSGYALSAAAETDAPRWTSIFHRSTELPCTFQFVDGQEGRIESAHLELSGTQVSVSGYVAKVGLAEVPAGAHVEIAVLDAQGNVLERKPAAYFPAKIPSPGRLGQPHAHFKADLDARPPANATLRIAFHEG